MSIRWTIQNANAHPRIVSVSGSITEDVDLHSITEVVGDGVLRLDLAGIEQINSCGVREWIHFVRDLAASETSFELMRCSPAMVRQLNMISNFRGNGTVRSVMLPYYCDNCGHEEHIAVELPADGPLPRIAETRPCPNCGSLAEFDDIPSAYFTFAA